MNDKYNFPIDVIATISTFLRATWAKAFSVSAPSVWNSLSYNCIDPPNFSALFKRSLQTELFYVASYRKREHSA